jgi:formylglycine-generating enzyme required for sulfatase activity
MIKSSLTAVGIVVTTILATVLTGSARASEISLLPGFVLMKGGYVHHGQPTDEPGRDDDESPQHSVTVPSFAMAAREVTKDEFAAFVQATGMLLPQNKALAVAECRATTTANF